jgi:hypothetical protein
MPETTAATVDYNAVAMPASITLDLLDSVCAAMQRRIDATDQTVNGQLPDVVLGQQIELRAWTKNVANLRTVYRTQVDAAVARKAAQATA